MMSPLRVALLLLGLFQMWAGVAPARARSPAAEAAAAVARFREAPAQAAADLQRAAARNPSVADALRILEAEARLAASDPAGARRVAEAVLAAKPRWPARAAFAAARGALPTDCRAALEHLKRTRADAAWIPAAARLSVLAEAQARCADPAAEATRRTLAVRHPATPEGAGALQGLALTPEEQLERAAALDRAREYAAAEAVLTEQLAGPLAEQARFRLGKLHLDRIREDFRVAERAFAQVAAAGGPLAEEASYLQARALGRAGDIPGAAAAYDAYLARWPLGAFAADAAFFRAFLDYEAGRYGSAAERFAALTEGPWARAAAWYRAWSLYLARAPDALATLDALAAAEPQGSDAARRAAYWAARLVEASDPTAARARYLRLAEERPLDWYALLVRRRHPGLAPVVPGLPGGKPARPGPPPKRAAAAVAQVRALAAAGLPEFARRVLSGARRELERAGAWALQADLARSVGAWARVRRGALARAAGALAGVPQAADAGEWRDAYPMAWPQDVAAAAKAHGVLEIRVNAFILKESGFDPDAVSPAHAVGLMQLLPRTARRIQEARGRSDDPAPDLFDPASNIDLGTWYLGALGRRFQDQLPLVAAAYNAGPPSVLSWFEGRARVPTDEFVERVPFRETREYVKRIAELTVVYQVVHQRRDADRAAQVLPLELDLAVLPGVDF